MAIVAGNIPAPTAANTAEFEGWKSEFELRTGRFFFITTAPGFLLLLALFFS